jgi:ribonuclease BN (tRNA processing enzyme)
MDGLRLVCLGCGDAFSARWYSSCLALEAGGTWLLVDCPHPIRKILRESGAACGLALDVDCFAGVVLTHRHADHVSGLEGWAYFSRFFLGRRAIVLTHPEVAAPVVVPGGTAELSEHVEIRSLREGSPTRFGPYAIECRRTRHSVPTFALCIEAAGRRLGYSADTGFDPTLIDWLAPCDLIVHETTHSDNHTPYEALAALPAVLRGKMRLIHYPDDFDLAASVIEPIEQGRSYEV